MDLWGSLKNIFLTESSPGESGQPSLSAPPPFVLKRESASAPNSNLPRSTQPFYTCSLSKMILQVEQSEELARTGHQGAKKALPELYHAMGMKFHLGVGVTKNAAEAFGWFMRAAELEYTPSLFRLAGMFKHQPNSQRQLLQIRGWLTKAIEHGNEKAMDFLGGLYEFGGVEVPPNPELAQEWYSRYNQIFMPPCTFAKKAYLLAKQYEQTEEIFQSDAIPSLHSQIQAVNWYTHAAKLGHMKAMGRLGMAYEEGALGLKKDFDKAKHWYDQYNLSLPAYKEDPTVRLLGEIGLKRITEMKKNTPLPDSDRLHG